MKCFICEKEINSKDRKHIYFCARQNKLNLNKNEIRYRQICYQTGFDITREFMTYHYLQLGYSLPDFKEKYKINYAQTPFLLDFFNIKRRGSKEAMTSINRLSKYKSTCKKKYGVENVSQLKLIKEKKKKTFMTHFGVDNIWKSKEYYGWLHDHMMEKYGKKSLPNRYGNMQKYWDGRTVEEKKEHMKPANIAYQKYWQALTDEQQNIIIQKRGRDIRLNPRFTSKLETRCCAILNNLCLSYIHQFWINRKSYDFKISHTHLIIEVQGDYWHASPEIYKANDIINYPEGYKKASEIWAKDEKKRKNAEKYNYKIIYVWESEFRKNNDIGLSKIIEGRLKSEGV